MMLMNIGVDKKGDKRRELADFFNAVGYARRDRRKWRAEDLTETVIERWRDYRDITVEMATHTGIEWGSMVLNPELFPEEIIERATRVFMLGIPGTLQLNLESTEAEGGYRPDFRSQLEIHDPLDMIWVNIQLDKLAGIGYQQCESRSCGKFFELPWYGDKRRRKKIFCNPVCASREQKAREQDDVKQKCRAALKRAQAEYRRRPVGAKNRQ